MASPSLAFKYHTRNYSSVEEFLNSVTETIEKTQLEEFNTIVNFSLDFPFRSSFESDVSKFVDQAVKLNVEELNLILTNGLHLSAYIKRFDRFPLPPFFNMNTFLKKMNLSMCSFHLFQEIKWDSLKELKIGYTCLETENNSYIKMIVAGCPVLEVLELSNCWGFKSLNFDDLTMLNKFVLNGIWPEIDQKLESLAISAPSVKVLEILGNIDMKNLVLENIGNCVEAKIDYYWTFGEHSQHSGGCSVDILLQVFNSLKDVQILTCGTWIIEVISRKYEANFQFVLLKCKLLTLHTPVEYRYQRGILRFIETCLNVETLVINASRSLPRCQICVNTRCLVDDSKGMISSDENDSNNTEIPEIQKSAYYEIIGGFRFKVLKMFSCGEGTHYGTLPPFLKYLVDNAKCWKEIVIE